MNSREKGAAYERYLCGVFRDNLGIDVQRQLGAPRDGGDDIRLGPYSIEAKRSERVLMQEWWSQCVSNADVRKPLLILRWSRGEDIVCMRMNDFLELAREEICAKDA